MEKNSSANKIVFVIVFGILLALTLCGLGKPSIALAEFDKKFEGFNLQGFDESGQKAWDVNGDTADFIGDTITISNVDANSFGEQQMNIKAQTGIMNQKSGLMHLEKDVVITNDEGAKMLTDSLDYDRDNDLVTTPDDVFISREDLIVTGTGLKAQPNLGNAHIFEDVTVEMEMKESEEQEKQEKVIITCDGPMVVNHTQSFATFEDNVVAIQTDRTLKADRMELYYDQKTEQIDKMICIGNVEVIQGENQSFSDRLVYSGSDQRLILEGRPKMIMFTGGDSGSSAFGD